MANFGYNLYSISLVQLIIFPFLIAGNSENNGIVFNYHRKILLAEKFEQIQFVLSFPNFDLTIDKFISEIAQRMDTLWNHPNKGCQLDYSNITATNFTSQWVLTEVIAEKERAENDLVKLQQELRAVPLKSYRASTSRTKRHSRCPVSRRCSWNLWSGHGIQRQTILYIRTNVWRMQSDW